MTKQIIASICVLGLLGMGVGVVATASTHEAGVSATVTVQNISVSVTDGTVSYGTIEAGASQDTVTLVDTQTATNNGNITEDLNIKGQDSGAWTLAGTASGATDYQHEFSTTSFAGGAGSPLTTSYQTLATGIAATSAETFDLKITTPPSASNYTEQSVNVTVQAVAGS